MTAHQATYIGTTLRLDIQQKTPSFKQEQIYEEEYIGDDLFEKLLNIVSETEKRKRGTRKARGVLLVGGAKNKSKKNQKCHLIWKEKIK